MSIIQKTRHFETKLEVAKHPEVDTRERFESLLKVKKAMQAVELASKLSGEGFSGTKSILKNKIHDARVNLRHAMPKRFNLEIKTPIETFKFQISNSNPLDSIAEIKDLKSQIIRKIRRQLKSPIISQKKTKSGFEFQMSNGLFSRPNSILEMMNQIKSKKVTTFKSPKSKENHIGVEIECLISKDRPIHEFHAALVDSGLEKQANATTDGSIEVSDGMRGVELTLCDTESEIFGTVVKATEVLKNFDVEVNASCGLHVHLDARNRNAREMSQRLIRAQPLLFAMVPETRRTNHFCMPTSYSQSIDSPGERYKAINLAAFQKHSTIEVRLHSGSYDFKKINHWIEILLSIIKTEIPLETPTTIEGWTSLLNLNEYSKSYIEKRVKKFNGEKQIQSHSEFFSKVNHDHSDDGEDICSTCESDCDSCSCFTCERCDDRFSDEEHHFDDENNESYCDSCMQEILNARRISKNER